jgi:predicted nucleic acid-binding protein
LVAPQGEEYETIVRINYEVNIPYTVLGAGEIETGAIAVHRRWAIGIDDKTAREYFAKNYSHVQLITTPELLKHWVDKVIPPKEEVRQVLERIRIIGNYSISKKHHLYAWWQSWL